MHDRQRETSMFARLAALNKPFSWRYTVAIRKFVDVDGITIETMESTGSGTPIFLVHGNSGSAQFFFDLLVSDFGKRRKLVAISLPGHGKSDASSTPETAYSIPGIGHFIVNFLKPYAHAPYWIIAQSLGAHAVMERLDSLSGLSGFISISAPPISLQTLSQAFQPDPSDGLLFKGPLSVAEAKRLAREFVERKENAGLISTEMLKTDPLFRQHLGMSLGRGEVLDEIRTFLNARCPVAFFHGAKDRFIHSGYYDSFPAHAAFPKKPVQFKNCGHALHLDDPVSFVCEVERFMQAVEPVR